MRLCFWCAILLAAIPANAGPLHFVKTHKLPLAADAVAALSTSADAASTIYAQRLCPSCTDNGWFGPHPSRTEVWIGTSAFAALIIAMNHAAYRHYRADGLQPSRFGQKFFVAFFTVPCVVNAAADVKENSEVFRDHSR